MRLGEHLITRGLVTQEQVDQALTEQQRLQRISQDEWIGQILLRHGAIQADDLAAVLKELKLIDAS